MNGVLHHVGWNLALYMINEAKMAVLYNDRLRFLKSFEQGLKQVVEDKNE